MGQLDRQRSGAKSAIGEVLHAGGPLRIIVAADGTMNAESDHAIANPAETARSTDKSADMTANAEATAEAHARDLPPDEVPPPGPGVGFAGKPLPHHDRLSGGSVIGGDPGSLAAGLGQGGTGC